MSWYPKIPCHINYVILLGLYKVIIKEKQIYNPLVINLNQSQLKANNSLSILKKI